MAVALKTAELVDRTGKKVDVHFYHLTKSNRKGVGEAIGADLVIDIARGGAEKGFWLILETKVNGKVVKKVIFKNQFVFRTNDNKRWQVLDRAGFNKRFSVSSDF